MIERVRTIMSYYNLSVNAFALKIGANQVTINQQMNGDRKLSLDTILKITNSFELISPDWLLSGKGEMFIKSGNGDLESKKENEDSAYDIQPYFKYDYTVKDFFKDYYSYLNHREIEQELLNKQLNELSEKDVEKIAHTMDLNYDDLSNGIEIVTSSSHTGKLVPVYNANAAAGRTDIDMNSSREGWINVGDLLKDSEGSLYVYGNSMIPGYPPGSLIGIRPLNESFIEPGSVYVVDTESNRYIKRLYYNKDMTALVCLSDNHIKHTDGPMEGEYLYPPFEIPLSSIKKVYKVIGVIKRNSISAM
jgi:phage repressor protein C with HTH and peptisase S24 domain